MIEWRDEGFVLAARPYGESAALLTVFTRDHGLHSGLVRGGGSRKMAAHMQPGTDLDLTWRARLHDQLGSFRAEPLRSRALILSDRLALEALGAMTGLLQLALPEREPHRALWEESRDLLEQMIRTGPRNDDWPGHYLLWELRLLEAIGYGLDLGSCAVTGAREGLSFVSPKTGRAVTRAAAGAWADRLLPLPAALVSGDHPGEGDLLPGLALTGHFLTRELTGDRAADPATAAPGLRGEARGSTPPAALPAARARLIGLFARKL